MTNIVGPRAVFGVVVPSTNTVVEHDYWGARVPGVAFRADRLEQELGKPVIAINAATLWHALREHGITDRVTGAGALLREH